MKLVQLYKQLKEENSKLGKVLVPRRSPEERAKNFLIATNKKVQEYIKNGSQGDLDLSNTPITSLPDNLTRVGGSLILRRTKITSLPDNLTKIKGSLYLDDTPITSLPKNLTVGGFLFLTDAPITSLPDNLTVGHSLSLNNSKIKNLPNDLKVGGDIGLWGTPISSQYTKEESKQIVPGIKGNVYCRL
jgi:hypothetical protein